MHHPAPVYPHSLIWRSDNPHPALTTLRNYLGSTPPGHRDAPPGHRDAPPSHRDAETWTPDWAHRRINNLTSRHD